MNGQPTTHPATEQLSAFGLGKLNDAAAAAIAQHLEGCLSCRKAVERVAGDTFVGLVRAAKAPASVAPSSTTPLPKDRNLNAPQAPAAPPAGLPPELAKHAKYRIVRELGRGGMGVVYQAEHIQMERLVAIKVINKSILGHPQALERFAREVKAAGKLSHPNIVAAFDFEQAGDLHMLVMEFVEGQNLAEIVVRKGPLPILNACHYVRQAALGLQQAFEKGMVHRDLKPQNLMLTPKGTVKLLDMGLARVASDKEGLTGTGATLGTPEYIAPEQAMDAAKADIRSDIYSLGCTLYCLLAGKPPFADGTAMQKILGHLEREPQPLPQLRPDVPEKLAAVVARMMAKDPAQRYQKPVEVAQALAPFCKAGAKGAAVEPVPVAKPAVPVVARVPATPTMATGASAVRWDTLTDDDTAGKVSAKKQKTQKVRSRSAGLAAKKKWLIGVAAAGVALLTFIVMIGLVGLWAAGVFKYKTKDGMIVLENLPPDADVTVDGGMVTVKPGDGKTFEVRIAADKKKHRLEVKRDGFKTFGDEVEVDAGGRKSVLVRLEPKENPADGGPNKGSVEKELDALRRDKIPPEALALAGDGDAKRAPTSLVAVLGEAQPIHSGEVWALAYSPDGRWLASASADKTIMLRDTATGRVQRVLRGHNGLVCAVGFSKDSRTLVSAGHDGTLRLWSLDKDEKPTIVEAKLGQQVIRAMAVSPDGRFVAAAGDSGLIKLWKWGAWEKPTELSDLSGKVKIGALAFSPDGELLACGGHEEKEDARVRIYATADGTEKRTIPNNTTRVTALSFSHDGKYLAAVRLAALKLPGGDGRVWEVASGKTVAELTRATFSGEWNDSCSVAWSPDDKMLAVGTIWRVLVYDFPTGAKRTLWFGLDQAIRGLSFSPHGDMLAAGGSRADLPVWDTTSWKLKYLERGHSGPVRSVAISPDGREVLSLGDEMALLRWQLARPEQAVVCHLDFGSDIQPYLHSVAYSRDGKSYVTPGSQMIAVRNRVTEKETVIRNRSGFGDPIVSPEGRMVAAWERDGHLHLWDLTLGSEVHRFSTKGRWCGLAFSRDGNFLAASNEETKRVMIWNVATGAETSSWEVKSVARVSAFDPLGQVLATGHDDGSILLWDIATGQIKRTLDGHKARVSSLKFTPDGKTLVSSGNDGIIRLWNPENVRAREVIPLGPANRPLTFDLDPSGKYLFAAGQTPVIFILRLPEGDK